MSKITLPLIIMMQDAVRPTPTTKEQRDKFEQKCWEAELMELGDIMYRERHPTLRRIAEEILAKRLAARC